MRSGTTLRIISVLAVTGALTLASAPAFASSGTSYTCAGGSIPSGSYSSLTVSGACDVEEGAVISVSGSVTVKAGAMLDAQSAPSSITVGGSVVALPGSFLGLGCQSPADTGNSAHPCTSDPNGASLIWVKGSITATRAAVVMINGLTVGGNVTVAGSRADVKGAGDEEGIPWSIKNNAVAGNVTVTGVRVNWIGLLFNHIARNVALAGIQVVDWHPEAPGMYLVRNAIGSNLSCAGISNLGTPSLANYGNQVTGNATGQCAPVS